MNSENAPFPFAQKSSDKLLSPLLTTSERQTLLIQEMSKLDKAPRWSRLIVSMGKVMIGLSLITGGIRATEPTAVDSLLKFEALELYTHLKGWELAQAFLHHFEYGGGRELDISHLYPEALRRAIETKQLFLDLENELSTYGESELVAAYVSQAFSTNDYIDYTQNDRVRYAYAQSFPEAGAEPTFYTENELSELIGQEVRFFQLHTGGGEEIKKSLGTFTLSINGVVEAVDEDSKQITLAPGSTITIVDRYDWQLGTTSEEEGTNQLKTQSSLGWILSTSPLRQYLNPMPEFLFSIDFGLRDRDGQDLVDAGWRNEFPVRGEWTQSENFSFGYESFSMPPA